ncbi:protein of unknown function [Serratia sp. Tan611]|nr:protein of unknown function [Serratia sp. Tan611]
MGYIIPLLFFSMHEMHVKCGSH